MTINPVLHTFNRLAYGPRPADLETKPEELSDYVEQQLEPESIADSEVDSRLQTFETLTMSGSEVLDKYPERRDQRAVLTELTAARLIRALEGRRQLEEVMTDFWFNHFNVFARKGICRILISSYETDAIRPHTLGKFRDLVKATARHPAMLFYLDNWMSVAPGFRSRNRRLRGLNENYARELMELHTLGVDGGYTQQDVIAVARAFTGWTIVGPRQPRFVFTSRMHDEDPKSVLGRTIDVGGMADGETVIDLLVEHPSTGHFISQKLVRRFVSDDPPPTLVAVVARVYEQTDGDIREMLRTIFRSVEFAASEGQKVKTPLEFVISAMRRLGARVANPGPLANVLNRLGQPLYGAIPPTGYSDEAIAWMSPGSLMNRLNFVTQLSVGRMRGVRVSDWNPQKVIQTLGSPEFQRK